MANCLVTKLKSTVDNSDLIGLGEVRIKIIAATAGVTLKSASSNGTKIKILTPGVTFTNAGAVGETEQTVSNAGARNCTVSGPCEIVIYDKYNLAQLEDSSYYTQMNIDELGYAINLTSLKIVGDSSSNKSTGSIAALKNSTLLTNIVLTNLGITGNISDLPTATGLWGLKFTVNENIHASITGDISNVPNKFTSLVDVDMRFIGGINGSVESFSGKCANLRDVALSNTNVSGSISGFANHASLRQLQLGNTQVTGNFGQLTDVPALAGLWVPATVIYTAADAARIDAILQGNGATIRPEGHYFTGGTLVENY